MDQCAASDAGAWYSEAGFVGVSVVTLQQLVCCAAIAVGYFVALMVSGTCD